MKLAIVYEPECPKLNPEAYSQTYRNMFLALIERFDDVQHINNNCSADDIDADVIFFYDIHSSHDVTIDGIEKHSALKYEYFNDPFQDEQIGVYANGVEFHKLNAKQRANRAIQRGVDYIVCPYTNGYYMNIDRYMDKDRLLWFPVAPKGNGISTPLTDRKKEVLANGHLWTGRHGFRPYKFRKWASKQDCVSYVEHCVNNKSAAKGDSFVSFVSEYAGALSLCDTHTVPKYSEIPLAGCVTFAQYQNDFEKMGFKDGESCIFVTKSNFHDRINDFKSHVEDYQRVADNGRKLIEENWTSNHFADFIYRHANDHRKDR